jgi:hypothetical protein
MASGVFRHGDLYTTREASMIMHRDGKTTTVSLMDFGTDRSLRTNGKSDGAINMDPNGARVSDEVTMTLTAAIPLAYRPDAAAAAVIGIGTGLTTHTLLGSSALRSVETIEIEPAMAEASKLFAPRNSSAFADRAAASRSTTPNPFFPHSRKYDIIISGRRIPGSAGCRAFTSEFYRMVRRHLNSDGVLVQWFQMCGSTRAWSFSAAGPGQAFRLRRLRVHRQRPAGRRGPGRAGAPARRRHRVPRWRAGCRVEVSSVTTSVRRISGKRSLAPMFAATACRQFRLLPYLDLNATKYRFLRSPPIS